jgi:hypothetical protein
VLVDRLDKQEVDRLLRHGAYHVFADDDNAANEFVAADVSCLLCIPTLHSLNVVVFFSSLDRLIRCCNDRHKWFGKAVRALNPAL